MPATQEYERLYAAKPGIRRRLPVPVSAPKKRLAPCFTGVWPANIDAGLDIFGLRELG